MNEQDKRAPTRKFTFFGNSPGGDTWTAVMIGKIIRDNGWCTAFFGYCNSACPVIFLGGRERHFTDAELVGKTLLGFHGSYDDSDGSVWFKDPVVNHSEGRFEVRSRAKACFELPWVA